MEKNFYPLEIKMGRCENILKFLLPCFYVKKLTKLIRYVKKFFPHYRLFLAIVKHIKKYFSKSKEILY